jgi:uncharacterized protein YraI
MARLMCFVVLVAGIVLLAAIPAAAVAAPGLQATPPMATVTGTPSGPMVITSEQVNVRSGPGTDYDKIGVLVAGQRVPALGRSPGGDWIQIVYPGVEGGVGWVYAYNVTLETGPGILSVVEPPPTQTPRVTATIDPTLAAQFPSLGQPLATRLPTFTPAAPVVQPTFAANGSSGESRGFPPILAILGLFVVGLFGTVISFLRGR